MNSRTQITSRWLTRLAEVYPQSADQLGNLADHLFTKQERLAALIRYCAAHPDLPMMRMYAEYSAALDALTLEPPRDEIGEITDQEAISLGPRERAGRTKRIRTRTKILSAIAQVIITTEGPNLFEEVAKLADVSVPTIYNYFRTRPQLVAAGYGHMVAQD